MSPENVLEKVWKTVAEKDYEPFRHHPSFVVFLQVCSSYTFTLPNFFMAAWIHFDGSTCGVHCILAKVMASSGYS